MYDDSYRLDAVANEIKKYFEEQKKSIFSSYSPKYKKADYSHWLKAAALCDELKVTSEVFVDSIFRYWGNSSVGPTPNSLYGPVARGCVTKYLQSKKASEVHNATTVNNSESSPAEEDIRAQIELVKRSLTRLKGNSNLDSLGIQYLSSTMTSYPDYIRVLMVPFNEKIKLLFGDEAKEFYLTNPAAFRAAEKLGYPIRNILLWLSARTP